MVKDGVERCGQAVIAARKGAARRRGQVIEFSGPGTSLQVLDPVPSQARGGYRGT